MLYSLYHDTIDTKYKYTNLSCILWLNAIHTKYAERMNIRCITNTIDTNEFVLHIEYNYIKCIVESDLYQLIQLT